MSSGGYGGISRGTKVDVAGRRAPSQRGPVLVSDIREALKNGTANRLTRVAKKLDIKA
jgi:hypothetical protein